MVDDKTIEKLLREIERHGIVYIACLKIGVDHSTFYRRYENDKEFRKKADQAMRHGRANNCDIAEYAVVNKAKNGDLNSAKYILGHNSPRYKPQRTSNVVFIHRKETSPSATPPPITAEEYARDYFGKGEDTKHEKSVMLYDTYTKFGRKIPNKPDGTPIELDEIISYEGYIKDLQKIEDEKKKEEPPKSLIGEPPPNTDKTGLENGENNSKSNSEPIPQVPAKQPQIHWHGSRNLY